MALQNSYIVKSGFFELVADVYSERGDKKTPNAQNYLIRRAYGSYTTNYWYQAQGKQQNDFTDQCVGTIRFPPEMEFIRAGTLLVDPEWGRLTERCMEKIYDQLRGNSEVLVDLAEAGDTIKLLKSVTKLRSGLIQFAKEVITSKNKKRKLADIASSKWLEFRYGIVPLMHTIYDASENLRKKVHDEPILVKARSGYTTRDDHRFYDGRDGDAFLNWWGSTELRSKIEVGFMFKPLPPSVQQLLHWTSLNPLTIAWELVPLSFVADWFVNVGDQLRSWENHTIFSQCFAGGYMTKVGREYRLGWTTSGTRAPKPQFWPDGQLIENAYLGSRYDANYVGQYCWKNRSKLTVLPGPVGFQLKVDLNAKRVTDAAALTSRWWRKLL